MSDLRYVVVNTISAVTVSKDMVNDIRTLKESFLLMSKENISDDQFDNSFVAVEDSIQRLNVSARIYKSVKMPETASRLRGEMYQEWKTISSHFPKMIEALDSGDKSKALSFYEGNLSKGLESLGAILSNIELNNTDIIEKQKEEIENLGAIDDRVSYVFAFCLNASVFLILLFFINKLVKSLTSTAGVINGTVDSSIISSDEVNLIAGDVKDIFNEISEAM
jgi:hypothetical protein